MADSDKNVLRCRDLNDRLVIDKGTTETLGRVTHLVVDADHHQVEGLVCKAGLLSQEQPVPWVQIEAIGADSIVVQLDGQAVSERFDTAFALTSQEVWSDVGNRVGQLVDYCFDPHTGAILTYLFTAPGWQGLTDGVYQFSPEAVVSAGRRRVMVRHTALANASQYEEGLSERAAELLQKDMAQTRADMKAVLGNTQDMAGQVQTQAKKLGEEARSRFGQLFGEVKQRTKHVRAQVNERVADVAANLQQGQEGQEQDKIPGTPGEKTIDVDAAEVWPPEDEG